MYILHLNRRLLTSLLLLATLQCQAGTILLVSSGKSEIYARFNDALNEKLASYNQQDSLHILDVNAYTSQYNSLTEKKFTMTVTVGIEASIALSNSQINTTTIMAMLPRNSYQKLSATGEIKCPNKTCRAIFLDQPVNRQLQFLRLVTPAAKQIAILSSNASTQLAEEIARTGRNMEFEVKIIKITDQENVLPEIKTNLGRPDVLMAIPDPVVYNRNTARAILLTAFHHRLPLFSYSGSYVRAGATFGLYSTPEDIARHVAELITSDPNKYPNEYTGSYPKYFTVDVNQRAADALGMPHIESAEINRSLMLYEKN